MCHSFCFLGFEHDFFASTKLERGFKILENVANAWLLWLYIVILNLQTLLMGFDCTPPCIHELIPLFVSCVNPTFPLWSVLGRPVRYHSGLPALLYTLHESWFFLKARFHVWLIVILAGLNYEGLVFNLTDDLKLCDLLPFCTVTTYSATERLFMFNWFSSSDMTHIIHICECKECEAGCYLSVSLPVTTHEKKNLPLQSINRLRPHLKACASPLHCECLSAPQWGNRGRTFWSGLKGTAWSWHTFR